MLDTTWDVCHNEYDSKETTTMNTTTTPNPSQAVGYDDGGRSYGMPGSVTRTAYLMRAKAARAAR